MEIDDGVEGGLPCGAVPRARHPYLAECGPAPGRSLTLHATRLGPTVVSVILGPCHPHLESVFAEVGVTGRTGLATTLSFDHG